MGISGPGPSSLREPHLICSTNQCFSCLSLPITDSEDDGESEAAKQLIQPIAEKIIAKYKAKEEEAPLLFFVAGEVSALGLGRLAGLAARRPTLRTGVMRGPRGCLKGPRDPGRRARAWKGVSETKWHEKLCHPARSLLHLPPCFVAQQPQSSWTPCGDSAAPCRLLPRPRARVAATTIVISTESLRFPKQPREDAQGDTAAVPVSFRPRPIP